MNSHTAMEHLFASYDLSIKVQEKGFNDPHCALRYPDNELMVGGIDLVSIMLRKCDDAVASPMIQQIIDWFRDEHKIEVAASYVAISNCYITVTGFISDAKCPIKPTKHSSYYEALTEAIKEALKLIP